MHGRSGEEMSLPWPQLENRIYWIVLVCGFLAFAWWESVRPHRPLASHAAQRWSKHGLLLIVGSLVTAPIFRLSPVMLALAFSGSRFGLLNRPWLPRATAYALTFMALDFTRYGVHWSLHATRLWRVHQIHHSDPEVDVSTGARTHPIEVIYDQAAEFAAIALFAPPAMAVLMVEIAFLVQSFLSHANICLPPALERRLRWIVVTPEMHRIHHSAEVTEQYKNLADIFSFWDRCFGTYLATAAAGDEAIRLGLHEISAEQSRTLAHMFFQPFRRGQSNSQATGATAG
jgi:sterol desaturase/sphingolipid hydroxylase (fatty acid hydroxylase superfamily)